MKINLHLSVLLILLFFKGSTAYSQSWTPLSTGMDLWVHCFQTDPVNQVLYAGGEFSHAGGNATSRIAQWNGIEWSSLGLGVNGPVRSMMMYNGELVVGGRFSMAGGITANSIAKWNGTTWSTFGTGMSPTSFVMGFAEFGGELYAAGSFSEAGGNAVQNIAKWNGTSWSAVGLGISSGSISSIAVYNGALYVAGQFSMAGGNPIKNIAKWDGSNWSGLSSGIDDRLYTLKVFNNELYAGGQFNTAGGNTISGIARWNGTSWNSLGSGGNFNVASLIEYDNKLYVGGTISNVGGIPVKNIASWDGLAWDSVGSGIRDVINTTPIVKGLAVYNGALIAGGCFSLFSGGPNDYISKFTITTAVKPEIASIKDLSVFPNPVEAGGKLNVKSDAPFSMTAYSLTGDKVLEVSYEMNQQVQLPHLSKGLYILAIHSAQGTAHRKLVVE